MASHSTQSSNPTLPVSLPKCLSELSKMILYNSDALTTNAAFGIQWRFLDFMFFLYFPLVAPKWVFFKLQHTQKIKNCSSNSSPSEINIPSYKINLCRMVWPSLLEENTTGTIWLGNYIWEGSNLQIKIRIMQARDSIPQIQ